MTKINLGVTPSRLIRLLRVFFWGVFIIYPVFTCSFHNHNFIRSIIQLTVPIFICLFWILKIKLSLENVIKVLFELKKIDTLGIR